MDQQSAGVPHPSFRNCFVAVGLIWLALFLIAQTGYPNLVDNERRIGAYVLDAVHNGHWLIQRDATNDVASKPPLLTWIASLITLACGRLTEFAMHFPSAIATLGSAWLILAAGWKRFGWRAGFLAALTYLLSPAADKQVFTARYDGLFALPVTWAALAAFQAWISGRGWTQFWLAAAVATMVKGPLGILLGAIGLLAAVWEWRSGNPLRPRGNHGPGVALYFAICGGWFALAYWQMGEPLIHKMIGRELVGHSLSNEEGGVGGKFWEPACNVFSYYLPWSLAAIFALWRVLRKPSGEKDARRFERFLFCWFFAGLILFSVAPHQRGRLIFPLLPALALLTGHELARWLANVRSAIVLRTAGGVAIFCLAFLTLYHHVLLGQEFHFLGLRTKPARQVNDTLAFRAMADQIRSKVGAEFPLTYLDIQFTLEFYLNTYRPEVSVADAAKLFRSGADVFVIVGGDADKLQQALGSNAPTLYPLMAQKIRTGQTIALLSNHPVLEWTPRMAAIIGPMSLQMENVQLRQARGNNFVFERNGNGKSGVTFSNLSEEPQRVRARFSDTPDFKQRLLKPGETWTI